MVIIKCQNICDKSIKFSNDCILKLKIDLKTYDNQKQYYYLSYEWIINDLKNHPFRDDKEYFDNHLDGEIVYKNDITDNLIRFLMMNNTELEIESGSTHPEHYRILIMKSISLFWD